MEILQFVIKTLVSTLIIASVSKRLPFSGLWSLLYPWLQSWRWSGFTRIPRTSWKFPNCHIRFSGWLFHHWFFYRITLLAKAEHRFLLRTIGIKRDLHNYLFRLDKIVARFKIEL